MNDIYRQMKREREKLAVQIRDLRASLSVAPEGALLCKRTRGHFRYFQTTKHNDKASGNADKPDAGTGAEANAEKAVRRYDSKYIPKENYALAERLAQKLYDRRLLRLLEQQLAVTDRFLKSFPDQDRSDVFESLGEGAGRLIGAPRSRG